MEAIMRSKPLGAYIRALREHIRPKMTQIKLAEKAHTSGNTINRIEAGTQEPQESLPAILTVVGGRIQDVLLLQAPDATTKLAKELAAQAITERELLEWAKTDERRMQLLLRIREMSVSDPDLRAQIDGYLDRHQGQ